ncbi:hypothetical protein GCM10011409_05050 [Lentibacillus populi]|uniref:Uncharacterized protein n=1 Tax=Lentibacillus populi TaxID=1827502 RepID=A0A9W5TUM0_9BACI|nr:hypothetical protein GCM10011409_05050 [Lentibacillus populi]
MHTSRWALELDVADPAVELYTANKFYNSLENHKLLEFMDMEGERFNGQENHL